MGFAILFGKARRSFGLGATLALGVGGCVDPEPQPPQLLRGAPSGQAGSAGTGGAGSGGTGRQAPRVPSLRECGQILPAPAGVLSADFALDGAAVVVAYADGSVELQRVGDVRGTLLRPAGDVQQALVSPDGQGVAWRAGDDLVVQSLTNSATKRAVTIGHQADCGSSGSITPDGQHLLLVGTPAVCLFNLADGALLTQMAPAWTVGFHDASLVVGTEDSVTSYDLTGAVTAERDFGEDQQFVALSPRGDTAVYRSRTAPTTSLFDVASGKVVAALPTTSQRFALFSRDGALVAFENSVLHASDGSLLRPAQREAFLSQVVALSLDGLRTLSLDGDPNERRAVLVDVTSGGGVQLFGGTPRLIYGLSVAPDGQRFVTTNGHTATGYEVAEDFAESRAIWTVDTGLELASEYSRDGSLVAISGDGRATVDALTGVRYLSPTPPAGVLDGCFNGYFGFSSDHRWVAGGGWRYEVDVFDTLTEARLTTLPSAGCNTSAAFSADDSLLATSSGELYRTGDFSRIWPTMVAPEQPSYDEALTGVQFLADGQSFVTSSCQTGDSQIGGAPFECHNSLHTITGATVRSSDLGNTNGRPAFSRDGRWLLDGLTESVLNLTAAAFAPNGDVIAGDKDGVIYRFCNTR